MAFMFNTHRHSNSTPSSRARTEAYAGLLLLLFAVTVLAFNRCSAPQSSSSLLLSRPSRPTATHSSIPGVVFGNAATDGQPSAGWWIGHFAPHSSLRHVHDVETKWAVHRAGKRHDGGKFALNSLATSMAVLVSGRHRVDFANGMSVTLATPGDYVVWGPGVAHSWQALHDSTILCIRWPSLPNDQRYDEAASHSNETGTGKHVTRVHDIVPQSQAVRAHVHERKTSQNKNDSELQNGDVVVQRKIGVANRTSVTKISNDSGANIMEIHEFIHKQPAARNNDTHTHKEKDLSLTTISHQSAHVRPDSAAVNSSVRGSMGNATERS